MSIILLNTDHVGIGNNAHYFIKYCQVLILNDQQNCNKFLKCNWYILSLKFHILLQSIHLLRLGYNFFSMYIHFCSSSDTNSFLSFHCNGLSVHVMTHLVGIIA